MRWPWQKTEIRSTDSDSTYSDLVSRLIQSQADGQSLQATKTAALEAAAGLLSRAFAGATVEAPDDVVAALSPQCRALLGRDLVRAGESLHVIRMTGGRVYLVPCSTWYWEGGADPRTWRVTATAYGPSGSTTWRLPWASVIFAAWGSATSRPYHGISPASWASDTARLAGNVERSLADETSGPVAQLLPVPDDGGDGGDDDPLKLLKSDISNAKGKAVILETTAAGWGQGMSGAPRRDWMASRLGPDPADAVVNVADASFARVLAAAGCSPALFDDSDGTAKREALRQFYLGTVGPLAKIVEAEASDKFGVPVKLRFDLYNVDLQGRAMAFKALVSNGVEIERALSMSGLLIDE